MKKIKKSFMIITLLLFYSNNTYATTTGTYTVNEGSVFGKFMLFVVAAILIGLVLFLSYKMDKDEASKERKERITGVSRPKKDLFDYKAIIEKIKSIIPEKKINEDYISHSEEMEDIEDEYIDDIYDDIYQEINNRIEEEDIKILDIPSHQVESEPEKEIEKENDIIIQKQDTSKIAITNFEEKIVENDKEVYYNTDDPNLNEFTMVFNSKLLKFDEQEHNTNDDDDDFGLEDIKETIAAANIKKYTRKKNGKEYKSKKQSKSVKRYTRKKNKNEVVREEPDNKVKVYTRKKGQPLIKKVVKSNKKSESDKPKLKRGRPKKQDKPKRGRPKKEVKPKRGRPKKEEKPKRGRPRKTDTTKKTNTKK